LIGDMNSLSQMAVPPGYNVCPGRSGHGGGPGPSPSSQAQPLRTAHLACAVTTAASGTSVDCRDAGPAVWNGTVALSQGDTFFAMGSGRLAHLVVHTKRRLRPGRCRLTVEIAGYRTVRLTVRPT